MEHKMEETVDLNQALKSVWQDGGTAWCESVVPIADANGEVWIPLYYHAEEIISLQNAELRTTYVPGKDYCLENGGIRILPGSSIRPLTMAECYPAAKGERTFDGRNGIPYILFSEGTFFHQHQLAVTYRHSDGWRGSVPQNDSAHVPLLTKRLKEKEAFRLLIYGDSITAGGNASGFTGIAPYLPRFGELYAENLMRLYGVQIDVVNTAVGGMTAEWGAENAKERAAAYQPDLVILGFGMNDGSGRRPPEEFAALTQSIMADVRAKKPEAEFLLVSSICPNREACLYGNQEDYPAALAALCGNGTVLANVTAVHQELLKRKRYMDMTGNNVNHPNDYLHRIYAQVLMALTAPQL